MMAAPKEYSTVGRTAPLLANKKVEQKALLTVDWMVHQMEL